MASNPTVVMRSALKSLFFKSLNKDASWTPGAQKTPASKKSDAFLPPNRLIVPQAPDALKGGLACDLLLARGTPREAPADMGQGWSWRR
jgi:hypothetical protein